MIHVVLSVSRQFDSRSSSIQADIGRFQLDLDRLKVSAKW